MNKEILAGIALILMVIIGAYVSTLVAPAPLAKSREQASAAYLRCRDTGARPDACEIEAVNLIQSRGLDRETASNAVRDLRARREE